MKKCLLVLLAAGVLVGCTTTTPTQNSLPKGKWLHVNEDGYIPPNTDVYMKSGDSFIKKGLQQPSSNEGAE